MNPAPPSSRFSWDSIPVAGSPAPRTPTPPVQRPAPARRDPVKPFTPCDAQRAQLIDDLTGEDFSLEELAERHETSVEAISTFIMTDAAVPQALSAGVMRVKLAAVTALAKAVDLLSAMIANYACEFRHDLVPPNPSTKQMMALEHKRDNARRACALLHRIANLNPRIPTLTPAPPPTPTPPPTKPAPTDRPTPDQAPRMEPAPTAVPAHSAVPALPAFTDASGSRSADLMPRRHNDSQGDGAAVCVSLPSAQCRMPDAIPVPLTPQPSISSDPELCEPPLHDGPQARSVPHKSARRRVCTTPEAPCAVRSGRSINALPDPPPRSGWPPEHHIREART